MALFPSSRLTSLITLSRHVRFARSVTAVDKRSFAAVSIPTVMRSGGTLPQPNRAAQVTPARFLEFYHNQYGILAKWDPDSVRDRVLMAIKGFDKVDASQVSVDTDLTKDLGLDSLDHIELLMAVEDEIEFEIPAEVSDTLTTPQLIIDWILEKKKQEASEAGE